MPGFIEIGPLVPEKKNLKGFNIYGHGGHLGHVTYILYIYIGSPIVLMLHIKFGFDWPNGFREDL